MNIIWVTTYLRKGRHWTGGTRRDIEPVPPPPPLPAPVSTSRTERKQLYKAVYKASKLTEEWAIKHRVTVVNKKTTPLFTLINPRGCFCSDKKKKKINQPQTPKVFNAVRIAVGRKGGVPNQCVIMKGNTCIIKISFIRCVIYRSFP